MPQTRRSGFRTRRFGVVASAAALVAVTSPAAAYAQDTTDPAAAGSTDTGSLEDVIGEIPEITIGDAGIGTGSEGLRDTGSGVIPDAALSVGETLGSVAPLEALGSTGGSAVASVASSGSLPGSVYANPVGSIGSGTIGLGSIAIPEYIFPILSLQFAGGYVAAMGERQEAAELFPHELTFWHDVVTGSAEGGTLAEAAAENAGTEVPGSLAGSIDSVQAAALEDPFEEQELLKAELAAKAEAAEAAEAAGTAGAAETTTDDDDASKTDAATGADAATTDVDASEAAEVAEAQTLDAAAAATPVTSPVEPQVGVSGEQGAVSVADAGQRLATTGADAVTVAGASVMSLLLGGLLLAFARRRA